MVVAFDIKDAATATAVWSVVAGTTDSKGRPFAESVLFKMPATAFQPNDSCDTPVQCFENTFPTVNNESYSEVNYFPYYSTSNISPNAFGDENGILSNIKTFQNDDNISFPAIEVDYKQNGGILDKTLKYARSYRGSSSTVGIFSPYAEYYYPSDGTQNSAFLHKYRLLLPPYDGLPVWSYYAKPERSHLIKSSNPISNNSESQLWCGATHGHGGRSGRLHLRNKQ